MYRLIQGDCTVELPKIIGDIQSPVIITDPPFNIGYHYRSYKDKMQEDEYFYMLKYLFAQTPCVVIHYPEPLYKLSSRMNRFPNKVVSWVYPCNMGRQHRDIAFYDIKPDFSKVRQPYREDSAKTRRLLAKGTGGAKIYDWWEINQVKNVSKEKTPHPCQMPLEVMERIVKILPEDITIIDPFMGSGTTGLAAIKNNRDFIGIELDQEYFNIAKQRIEQAL